MTPSPTSPRDQLTIPTLPPGYDPPAPSLDPAGPTGADPNPGADLAHLAELLAHWLTVGALVAAVGAVLVYALTCALWPYRTCPRCHGYSRLVPARTGRLRGALGAVRPRACRRCHGTGLRLRLGRRAWNHYARFRHARRTTRLREQWHDNRPGPGHF